MNFPEIKRARSRRVERLSRAEWCKQVAAVLYGLNDKVGDSEFEVILKLLDEILKQAEIDEK